MFSKFFIERPRFAFVLSIVLILAGAISIGNLPVAEYPEVTPPSIIIFTHYTGASAADVESTVAMPLESELNGLEDMLYFNSECNNSGGYVAFITFKTGVNDDIAMVNVQNAVKRAENRLPAEVRAVGLNIRKRSNDMLCMYNFTTDGSNMSLSDLNNYVGTYVVDTLSRVDGVSSVEALGASTYSMRIWLDPLRMSALGVSTAELMSAIQNQNLQAAAGNIGSEEASRYLEYKLNVRGRMVSPEEFENIIVRRDNQGNLLRMKDIARVELGAEGYNVGATYNGQPTIACAIYRNTDANALSVVKRAKAKVEEISRYMPEGVEANLAWDPTRFIEISMKEIISTLLIALGMVIIITYIFLQDWRATLVPSLAIPVSLMATFPVMHMLGMSMNVLSMFGLVLVIGSLVDDAIVVVENCQSLMAREKLSAREAAIKTMSQVTGAIIATTLVTVACYMPLAFYGGMVGKIYIQFAITMCISLCFSTFVATTLSPVVCSLILRPPAEKPSIIFKPFNGILEGTRRFYLFFVRFLTRQGVLTLLLLAAIIGGIWYFSQRTPSSFLPLEDKGAILGAVELAPGATIERTMATLETCRERLKDVPGVRNLLFIGGFSLIAGEGENVAFLVIDFDDWSDRTTPDTQLLAMKAKVEAALATIPEATIQVFTPPAIQGLGTTGGISFELCSDGSFTPQQLADEARALCGK
ncbi:MAG: efflux RND transporter permease subunit, partial [Victivallales bacterium]|nr:efflux RND transporter permease subunit [Victivallales bacterium]